MKTVILPGGWIFAGQITTRGDQIVINGAECVVSGAGGWQPPAGSIVTAPAATAIIVEGPDHAET